MPSMQVLTQLLACGALRRDQKSPGRAGTFQIVHLAGMLLCKIFEELPGFALAPGSDKYIGKAGDGLGVFRPQLRG